MSFIDQVINDRDNLNLTEDLTIDELHTIIKSMEPNKSPGIDGIPVEFYQIFWDIIKLELFELIQYLLSANTLSETQRKAIIVLIEKGEDLNFLSSWRPISLLCVDTKIIAKCIAFRLKDVIEKCISKNQFCSPAKSIIECNNIMRDTLYYANNNNIQGAVINVDWCRAFDSIDHDLLFKIMRKMGFCSAFINWIKLLYNGAMSSCIVNGFLTRSFNIGRGVRQGCPLSMLLFVIFQEPLYRVIERSNVIRPIILPCNTRKALGYADDTSFIISDDRSIVECFTILGRFENASGIKLNKQKTKLLGFGAWKDRQLWPVDGITILHGSITILGIQYNNNYNNAILLSWTKIVETIKSKVNLLTIRKFNIYQSNTY